MLRSARLMPPGPTVSPTDCRMPCFSGIDRSRAMLRKPPVETVTTTKSAPSRAARWSVVVSTVAPTPSLAAAISKYACIFGSGAGSRSSSTTWTSASDGVVRMSPISVGLHW